ADALRRDAEQPLTGDVVSPWRPRPFQEQALEKLDVTVGKQQAREHPRDRALLVHALEEDSRKYGRTQRRCREPECEGNSLRAPPGRVEPEIARYQDGKCRSDATCQKLALLRDPGQQNALDQIVWDSSRDHDHQARGGGKRGG